MRPSLMGYSRRTRLPSTNTPAGRLEGGINVLGSFSASFMVCGWERHSAEWHISFANREIGVPGGKMGAAPRPDFGTDRQARFHRVLMDVRNGLIEVRLIADIAIPILAVPDGSAAGLAGAPQVIADFPSRELLP